MSADDMCIDYKKKFKVKVGKLYKGQLQVGLFINRDEVPTYYGTLHETYLYVCLLKWHISIGWLVV